MINLMQTNWQKLTEDPVLKDRPYDVETNEHGQLIMTPVSDNHAFYAAEIAFLLRSMLPDGIAQVETPLTTKKGTKSLGALVRYMINAKIK